MQKKLLSPKLKDQIEKIVWITFFWMIISIFQFLTGYSTLHQFNCDVAELNATTYLLGSIVTGISAGIIGGSFLVIYWKAWLRTMAYGRSLLHIFWTYTVIYLMVSLISGTFLHSTQLDASIVSSEVWGVILGDLTSLFQIHNYLFWLMITIITLIALLVNDKYGPGVFVSFLLGKYFHPQREERVFMFLDLRGSTSIAEHLSEDRYFNFLKDAYKDATPAILDSHGEIYQYVGDEIVVSWKREKGAENANALRCYFDILGRIKARATYYQETYSGRVPDFKAGLHFGFVMAGEIGIVKRDIAYSGDVLNTTSRIQSKCNELNVNILLSKYLLEMLGSLPPNFQPKEVGAIALRGKEQSMVLYTV